MTSTKGYLKLASKNPILVGWMVFIFLATVTVIFSLWVLQVEKRNSIYEVEQRSNEIRDNLEGALTNSVIATSMITYLVENNIIKNNFDSLSHDLLGKYKYIDALQLVEGSIIVNTYPIVGNESIIGYDLSTNRSHVLEMMKSVSRNQLYFEGPFSLRQGGVGIVGRRPIYKKGEFWGFASVVIRSETLIEAIGVNETGLDDKYQYQITKTNEDSTSSSLFANQQWSESGIHHTSFVPIGDWYVVVRARYPEHVIRAAPIFFLGFLLSAVIGFFAWFMANEPKKLDRLVTEKTESLENANLELEYQRRKLLLTNAELKQFAFVVSHDLQEPLRMISSFLSKLDQNYSDQLDEKARKYIHFAVDGANRMRSLIIDLLEYSNVGDKVRSIENVDINEVMNDVLQIHRDTITAKSATVVCEQIPIIQGYRSPLVQLFGNLLQNALKYSKDDVPPRIEITAKDRGSQIEISFSDNGIGFAPEYYDKIFIIFQRLHSKAEYSGTGIGLAIVKKVIDMHGGSIRVESTTDVGTTFIFTLNKTLDRNVRNED
jgi:signal transduction histidine kinase